MSGIDREIILDRRHIAKHLPDSPQSNRLLRRGRSAHVFHDEAALRYGLLFSDAIGVRISPDGSIGLAPCSRPPICAQNASSALVCCRSQDLKRTDSDSDRLSYM
ncbi:MAG: hypothetical protein B0A82_08060 [Alkalinema sp. CACIAM 70d]|nr:MAG: hypothetical protein B0A82_08060 [Alkalinema sp. CACIAM 70d]